MDVFGVLFNLFLTVVFVFGWKKHFLPSGYFRSSKEITIGCCLFMAACAVSILLVLGKWSAPDVRKDFMEVSFYLVESLAGVAIAQSLFGALGVSLRDDAIERENRGALLAAGGFTAGAMCCVAGANVGEGPGNAAVLFCGVLALGGLLASWLIVAMASGMADTITIERDIGAGLRTGAWLAGSGAILGASVTGDWFSAEATVRDFVHFGWPLFAGAGIYGFFERMVTSRPPGRSISVAVSAAAAVFFLMLEGGYAVWVAKH
jgi:hypothetical protein